MLHQQIVNAISAVRGTEPVRWAGETARASLKLIERCYRNRVLMPLPWMSRLEYRQAQKAGACLGNFDGRSRSWEPTGFIGAAPFEMLHWTENSRSAPSSAPIPDCTLARFNLDWKLADARNEHAMRKPLTDARSSSTP